MLEDEHGRGQACDKCGKIVYIVIFNEYPLGDAWGTDGSKWYHNNCEDTLAITGKFTMLEYLPKTIQDNIKQLEKELADCGMNNPSNPNLIMTEINKEKIEHTLFVLKNLIPIRAGHEVAKSCEVVN